MTFVLAAFLAIQTAAAPAAAPVEMPRTDARAAARPSEAKPAEPAKPLFEPTEVKTTG